MLFLAVGRLLRLMLLTAAFAVAFLTHPLVRPGAGPALLRWYLQTCGATFIKFGQILAMRYDLLPTEYCEELSTLLDEVPAEPPASIERAIKQGLGRSVDACFARFDRKPVGSASLAQVHRARLRTGEEVAVKVMRSGIRPRVDVDLWAMALLARAVDATEFLDNIRLRGLVEEYKVLYREELNFRREGRNAQLLHDLMESDPIDHRAPRVYFDYTSDTVLTLEWFEGVKMRDLLSAINRGDRLQLDELAARGITPERTARLLFRSIMEQCYHHRVFHADPHAGNLILLEGGTLAYIDFGMIGWLDEKLWKRQYKLFECVAQERIDASYQAMLDTLEPVSPRHLTDFERGFKRLLRDWIMSARSPDATIEDKSSGRFLLRASGVIRRAGMALPWDVSRLHRTTIISDIIELRLYPRIDLVHEMRQFFEEETLRQLGALWGVPQTIATLSAAWQLLVTGPTAGQAVVTWLESRLPEVARTYSESASRFERMATALLRSTRRGAWLLMVALLGSRVLLVMPGSFWPGLRRMATELWFSGWHGYGFTGAAIFTVWLLGRMIAQLENPD